MTQTLDPQHQAVITAAESLRATRHFHRTNAQRQNEYLHELEALAGEVLLNLREAGIDGKRILTTYQTISETPRGCLELAIRAACDQIRQDQCADMATPEHQAGA